LLLSNSGETAELSDMVRHSKRFSVPLIVMVRNGQSMLAEAATHALIVPNIAEASQVKAPTTSTTMMLALGDALAVTASQAKGFSSHDYHLLHPAGQLGAMFTRVGEVMHQGDAIPFVSPHTPMAEVILEMSRKRLGCAVVIDEKKRLLGMVTDGDLRRNIERVSSHNAEQIMTVMPKTISEQSLVDEALHVMNSRAITVLVVCREDQQVQGVLHIHDCLRSR
jgi:arabinose-5-phosphate isomerase